MLEAARAQQAAGVDVVIGWVETHGRAETEALLPGLERLPPRAVEYRGTTLREFDLDAALARRPALILVDELAHTNAPGSRHAKRWQDVTELLAAGIDVYTTLNVQHLESLNDVVARVTGVPTRETVPDSILEEAAEVELVDLPPDDLIRRLKEGKVYFPEQAGEAVRRFFRKGNLIALRELALRTTAAQRGRPDGGLPPRPCRPRHVARGRAHPGLRQPESLRRARRAGRSADGRRASGRVGGRQRRDAGHRPPLGRGPGPHRPDPPPSRAARRGNDHSVGTRRRRGGPHVRASPQRHAHRPR